VPASIEIALGQKILAGLMSGAIAAAVFNPTDVLKVRPAQPLIATHGALD
jgi:hypothetical protein